MWQRMFCVSVMCSALRRELQLTIDTNYLDKDKSRNVRLRCLTTTSRTRYLWSEGDGGIPSPHRRVNFL